MAARSGDGGVVIVAFGGFEPLGSFDQVDRRFNRGRINLKVNQALEQSALEMDKRGLLRIDGGVRFEPLKRLEESFSKFTVG